MGLFAAFLIWQHIGQQKRMDSLVERMSDCQQGFQDQLDKISADYDVRIERMRERYDAVIREARDEGEVTRISRLDRHKDLTEKLAVVQTKLDQVILDLNRS